MVADRQAAQAARGPLRHREFRLLFAARTVSFFGTNLAPIAVAFAVLGLTHSATDVGLSFAAWTLAQVSTLVLGGVAGDRLPRRLVMVASDTGNFVVRLTMGLLLVTGHAQVWQLVALQAVGGAATAFYSPASSGLVPQTVPKAELQGANAYMSIARYAVFPVAAAVGGTIVATIGSGTALLVDAGTYAASALLLLQMRLPERARATAGPSVLRQLREGWSAFTEQTWVWLVTLWISLYFLVTYAPFFVLGPYVASRSMHGAAGWAVVVTGEAVGALLGGLLGLRWLPGRALVVIGPFFVVTGLQSALLATHAPLAAIAVAAALAGCAFSYGSVVWETCIQERIAPEKLSRVAAYNWMGAMAFLPAGYALAGPVAAAIGVSTTLWIGVAWIAVSTAAIMTVREVRDFRRRAATPDAEPVAAPV